VSPLYQHPVNLYITAFLLAVAVLSLVLAVRRFLTAYRRASDTTCALWLTRGLRFVLIGLTAGAWAASFYWNQRWLLIIGLVIICQELYEGAMIAAALRKGARIENGEKGPF
jgi:multisubunit Na+/H+ antiporter MnhG subunit